MTDIIGFTDSLDTMLRQADITAIMKTNLKSMQYGLVLSETEAGEIISTRDSALRSLGRVELGIEAIGKLITTFCDSPYLSQSNYTATICELVDAFYYMKNETLDKIGDDELISMMKDCFDNRCCGSVDLLVSRELESFARDIRNGCCSGSSPWRKLTDRDGE